jgi:hypothetical protein
VVYVVDCCFVKQKAYDPKRGMESLELLGYRVKGIGSRV